MPHALLNARARVCVWVVPTIGKSYLYVRVYCTYYSVIYTADVFKWQAEVDNPRVYILT